MRSLGELLAVRTSTQLALALPAPPAAPGASDDAIVAAVTAGVTAPGVLAAMRALGRGPLRYRLHFTDMGPRRALVLRIASALSDRCPELRNDPTDSPWELRVGGGHLPTAPLRLELVPRQLPDARFAYRTGDVPAASHPTLAAALARLCAAQPGDVVWDPFVGSGSELIEVALLARARAGDRPVVCVGSDLSAAALATAAANADAAEVELTLRRADALAPPPPGLTRIITNPPMGRRVQRGTATELLGRFAEHAAHVLPRRGQLTFIAPQPQRTGPILQAGGLRLHAAHPVDMNGFWARIEVWRKP
jgi:predicted RNA methylase